MQIKVKKINELAMLPARQNEGDACWDLPIPENVIVPKGRSVIKLGYALEVPEGYYAEVRPRSGFSSKGVEGYTFVYSGKDKLITNASTSRFDADIILGTIDRGYRGEIGIIINNHGEEFFLPRETRLAQLMIKSYVTAEFIEAEELEESERGEGGFGSTGAV